MSEMTIGRIVTTTDPLTGSRAPSLVIDEEALRQMVRRLIIEVANEMREQGLLR